MSFCNRNPAMFLIVFPARRIELDNGHISTDWTRTTRASSVKASTSQVFFSSSRHEAENPE